MDRPRARIGACRPVYAYLDGVTGSMVFQILIAGGLGAVFFLRGFWGRIRLFFVRLGRPRASAFREEEGDDGPGRDD